MSEQLPNQINAELVRRHRTAVRVARVLLALTVSLSAAAFVGRSHFRQQDNPTLDMAVRVIILICGLGSVVLRRTRFSAMRLQDIAALKGITGLLATLERTTIQVSLLGAAVAVFGFVATLMTGNDFYAYGAGVVGVVVLLYCYPTQTTWRQATASFGPAAPDYPQPPTS